MNREKFEKIIGYTFKDKSLLRTALTHSSCCRERKNCYSVNNERLEFLGDAFFDAVVSAELYKKMGKVDEGVLTKTRAQVVCESSLASAGKKLNLGEYLYMGRGEEAIGGRNRKSNIADAMEAIIGAIFLDGGYEAAADFINRQFKSTMEDAINGKLFTDFKTRIQEEIQKKKDGSTLKYVLDRTSGPDHNKTFYVHIECDGKLLGRGSGSSKKQAEQQAAKAALERGV